MTSIILRVMKWCCAFLALSLVAQPTEREKALGARLREEILREAKPITNETATAYTKQLTSRFPLNLQVDLIEIRAADPMALPGGFVLIPANALRNARSETDFLRAFAHAVAHIELRHGIQQKGESQIPLIFMGGWSGIHPDPMRPNTIPLAFRKQQTQFEQEANDYAAWKILAEPDTAAFAAAKSSLKP